MKSSIHGSGADGTFGLSPGAPLVLAARVISLKVVPAREECVCVCVSGVPDVSHGPSP